MQYAISVTRFNEKDEMEVLVDQWITADQAIDLIVKYNSPEVEVTEEVEPVIEGYNAPYTGPVWDISNDPFAPKKEEETPKRAYKCRNCGQHGHNSKKCTSGKVAIGVKASTASFDSVIPGTPKMQPLVKNDPGKDYRSLTAKVRELFDQGLDFVEVCNELQEHEMVEIKAIYDDFEARLKHK